MFAPSELATLFGACPANPVTGAPGLSWFAVARVAV